MTPFDIGLLALAAMMILVLAGMFVPVALMLCSFVGVWAIKDSPELAVLLMAQAANDAIASYFFGIVPLFVLMGCVAAESGLGRDMYTVAHEAFRRVRGGLGIGTVAANAVFAAITGISIASAAVFTRIAVPEMVLRGYSPRFATGVVAGSSVLGMLIPPSLLLILYSFLTDQSVGDLFLAGIVPGILLAVLFSMTILIGAWVIPRWLGTPDLTTNDDSRASMPSLILVALPSTALVVIVLGGIYGGMFTPVEAGAVGAMISIVIGALRGRLSLPACRRVLIETGLVTASICLLIVAAQIYSRMLALSGVPSGAAELVAVADLGYWDLMLLYVALLIVMGMILDSSSILLIVVPVMVPVIAPMQLDLVWFGIVTILAIEIGLLTPPFGVSVYTIAATLDKRVATLNDIFIGALPFACLMLLTVILLIAYPLLATGILG